MGLFKEYITEQVQQFAIQFKDNKQAELAYESMIKKFPDTKMALVKISNNKIFFKCKHQDMMKSIKNYMTNVAGGKLI